MKTSCLLILVVLYIVCTTVGKTMQEETATIQKGGQQKKFAQEILKAHNEYRKKHGSPSLKWSNKLAKMAQKWAYKLARTGSIYHSQRKGIGENIAVGSSYVITGQKACDNWYNEITKYDFNNPGWSSKTGHFTQVVWASTTEMGAGRATRGKRTYIVANYKPAGNVLGKFKENVKKPI